MQECRSRSVLRPDAAVLRPDANIPPADVTVPPADFTVTRWKPLELTGWGRSRRARVLACRPETVPEAVEALRELDGAGDSLIGHGAGRSYGDLALNDGGRVLLTERLDRIEGFDETRLEVICEPGVTFGHLLEAFGPREILFPLTPGTAATTVAGGVAADVHGKNHETAASFGHHVRWIDLALADGEVRRVSPSEDPELFRATIGGLGLTGIILRVCFGLVPVPSLTLRVTEQRHDGLDALLDAYEASRHSAPYMAAWLDALAPAKHLGRGILQTADYGPDTGCSEAGRRGATVPFDLPASVLSRAAVRVFNALYYRKVPRSGRTRIVPLERFLYPLDRVRNWNRLYGRRGLLQFQCLLPDEEARAGLRALLEAVEAEAIGSYLAVLKSMGDHAPAGLLSFPGAGYTLALDFPNTKAARRLVARLERIALEHEGRVYLAKDATLSPDTFRAMYPAHGRFQDVLERVDPDGRFASDLSRRLRVHG